jgi:hypothetical protein
MAHIKSSDSRIKSSDSRTIVVFIRQMKQCKSGESRSKVKAKSSHGQVEVRLGHLIVGFGHLIVRFIVRLRSYRSQVWSSHGQVHSQVEVIL